jgi:hypothetical protein
VNSGSYESLLPPGLSGVSDPPSAAAERHPFRHPAPTSENYGSENFRCGGARDRGYDHRDDEERPATARYAARRGAGRLALARVGLHTLTTLNAMHYCAQRFQYSVLHVISPERLNPYTNEGALSAQP